MRNSFPRMLCVLSFACWALLVSPTARSDEAKKPSEGPSDRHGRLEGRLTMGKWGASADGASPAAPDGTRPARAGAGQAPRSSAQGSATQRPDEPTTATRKPRAWQTGLSHMGRSWIEPPKATVNQRRDDDKPLKVHWDLVSWDPSQAMTIALKEQNIQFQTVPVSYLLVKMVAEVSRRSVKEEIEANSNVLQEAISKILLSLSVERLKSTEGKVIVKRRVLRAINRIIETGAARDIYFTKFVFFEGS